jgi:hypothetical protein
MRWYPAFSKRTNASLEPSERQSHRAPTCFQLVENQSSDSHPTEIRGDIDSFDFAISAAVIDNRAAAGDTALDTRDKKRHIGPAKDRDRKQVIAFRRVEADQVRVELLNQATHVVGGRIGGFNDDLPHAVVPSPLLALPLPANDDVLAVGPKHALG